MNGLSRGVLLRRVVEAAFSDDPSAAAAVLANYAKERVVQEGHSCGHHPAKLQRPGLDMSIELFSCRA